MDNSKLTIGKCITLMCIMPFISSIPYGNSELSHILRKDYHQEKPWILRSNINLGLFIASVILAALLIIAICVSCFRWAFCKNEAKKVITKISNFRWIAIFYN